MTAQGDQVPTVTELLLARAEDADPGLVFEGRQWTWAEHLRECADRAALLRSLRRPGPFHVGVLMDNTPEFSFLLGGAALAGAVVVGLNTSRRGEALVRDIKLADCQVVLTDSRYVELLQGLEIGARVLDVDSAAWHVSAYRHQYAPLEAVPATPDDLLMLIFTSGTSGEPKAVRCTHGKIAGPGRMLAARYGLGQGDTTYVSMPMFHSNAIIAGWAVGLAAGARIALRRRFSASGFLEDVRDYGVTYANYVGKPLSYVLSTPEKPDDADNPLKVMFGNEANARDVEAFATRFGCQVVDAYGSTEGGIVVPRPPGTPQGSLGHLDPPLAVLDPSGAPCPPGEVGELVNTSGAGQFAGYYKDSSADADRVRDGRFWSGDLVYQDEDGYLFFVGRTSEWLRVDGENLGAGPIERVLLRHPSVAEAAVYAVPDPHAGDQVMAALVVRGEFDPDEFAEFLAAQTDLGPKQVPRFLRITARLPRTATYKVLKRTLSAQRWRTPDTVWWRPGRELEFEPLTPSSDPIRLDWGARSVRP
ncbi:long-chain-fatty-acid--CoA ligase [Actinophytocola algeriensis]|uniref:Fatty-acyl-CoA synthase n=1 Tax=Actinophytocola algeriensis TaxID=1768010 RepID=A0A7W7VBG9_9PSEU|nr:long-chain-fatty-acid--CoA ligase [Actinophytocola algeriensis]MBB4904123.1 fatty-acyl-CoA synthase [Actinophytocola algeriensis]MBE1477020.1 fatty-acyl-CoA synthase [Actinophytocola algeriensis]